MLLPTRACCPWHDCEGLLVIASAAEIAARRQHQSTRDRGHCEKRRLTGEIITLKRTVGA